MVDNGSLPMWVAKPYFWEVSLLSDVYSKGLASVWRLSSVTDLYFLTMRFYTCCLCCINLMSFEIFIAIL